MATILPEATGDGQGTFADVLPTPEPDDQSTPRNRLEGESHTPDPFHPAALRLSQDFASSVGVKKVLTTVPCRKPNRHEFFRVRPGEDWRLETGVFEDKVNREVYLVKRELLGELMGEVHATCLFLAINRQGDVFLWPAKLPGADGRSNTWNESALAAAQLAEDLQVFRGILTSRLAALRERYRAIDANDQTQKESVRKQMAAIANRIENFDDIRQTIEQGASAGVPDSATAWMQQQLEDMKIALAEEEAALQLTATAMRTQLADTTREIARSFRMIELQSRLPSEQIRRLQMTQASTKEVLGKLVREHRRATEAVLGIIAKGEDGPAPAENELLERVDRLLGNTRTAPGHNND